MPSHSRVSGYVRTSKYNVQELFANLLRIQLDRLYRASRILAYYGLYAVTVYLRVGTQ
eukprot:SAG31_NODE_301_length_18103_cov_13.772551_7_plen_58_part_00